MEKQHIETQTLKLIGQDFALSASISYPDLEKLLAEKLADMMAYELEHLFNILYRMDVTEDKIKIALDPNNPELPHVALAKTIIQRQEQRVKTKLAYPQKGKPIFGG